jgi:dienelactone hydrolase
MRHRCAVALAAAILPFAALAQESPSGPLAARVELHPIHSLTLSDPEFMTGDPRNGKPVVISGELRIAQGAGRLPVVVLMHGSGGIGPNIEAWAQQLNAMGISTFAIDGMTGRGLTGVSTNQALLGRLNFIVDIYQALIVIANHPRVDRDRIALMGFSRGGQAALYASLERFHRLWNKSGAQFAAYIPFYPDCATTYIGDTEVANRPIRIFHGTPDDYNPVASCKRYVERLREAKRDVALVEYPNAPHGFDNPLGAVPARAAANAQTVRNCTIRENPVGVFVNTATSAPFTYKDACVELNPHVGADPEATRAAHRAVKELLRSLFNLS